jgi:hypothetical protein
MQPSRKSIARRIRNLHRRRVPLNLPAVKRSHPALVKAVYSVRPFWGWKSALEPSGVEYSEIRKRLEDEVRCWLCGKMLGCLPVHLKAVHSIDGDGYLQDHPDAEVVSESFRNL